MTHEDQLRERIVAALQSRHATDSVRVTTNDNTLTMGTDAAGVSARLRTYLTLERAMVELDDINPKVADDLRDRMDAIWHALTESERDRLDDRIECSWSACAETGLGHERTTVMWHESELDALTSLAISLGLDGEGNDPRAEVERLRTEALAASDRIDDESDECERLTAERDAAVARVDRLRADSADYGVLLGDVTDALEVTLAERDDARAEVERLRARIDAAAVVAADLIHEERCDWSGEPGREADCDCGVNTLRAMLASAAAR